MITLSILLIDVASITLVGLAVLALLVIAGLVALAVPGIALGGVLTVLVIAVGLLIGLGYVIYLLLSLILRLPTSQREAAVRVK